MSFALRLAVLSLLLYAPARAQDMEVGTSLVCDTQEQIERVITLFRGNMQFAVNAVNTAEKDPNACGVVNMAYLRGREVAMIRTKTGTFRILRVLAVGVVTEGGIAPTGPAIYFALDAVDEREASARSVPASATRG
jgi:hypothetical protein